MSMFDSDNGVGLCMAFDEKLTRLNNLQSLMAVADADCAIHFCVPWHLMTALQSVYFQLESLMTYQTCCKPLGSKQSSMQAE